MKKLHYLITRRGENGKPVYLQHLRSGLTGRGRGFSESSDPDYAWRTTDPIDVLVYYDYLMNVVESPYEWRVVGYMMEESQRSWAQVGGSVTEYEDVLPEGETISNWRERMVMSHREDDYRKKYEDLSNNYQ